MVKKIEPVAPRAIPKELEPLAREARKFKTAEEFVRSQKIIYHGTRKRFDIFEEGFKGTGKGSSQEGIWFTKNRQEAEAIAEFTARGKFPSVKEAIVIPKNKLIIDIKGEVLIPSNADKILKKARVDGYDVVEFKNVNIVGKITTDHIVSLDATNIITKQQLKDFHAQAIKAQKNKINPSKDMKALSEKKIIELWNYLEKMKETARANKEIADHLQKPYYEGHERAFQYALTKLDWLLKHSSPDNPEKERGVEILPNSITEEEVMETKAWLDEIRKKHKIKGNIPDKIVLKELERETKKEKR